MVSILINAAPRSVPDHRQRDRQAAVTDDFLGVFVFDFLKQRQRRRDVVIFGIDRGEELFLEFAMLVEPRGHLVERIAEGAGEVLFVFVFELSSRDVAERFVLVFLGQA